MMVKIKGIRSLFLPSGEESGTFRASRSRLQNSYQSSQNRRAFIGFLSCQLRINTECVQLETEVPRSGGSRSFINNHNHPNKLQI